MNKFWIFILLVTSSICSKGQVGGKSTYQFLNIVTSPKIAALGGIAIAIEDADLEMTYFNPALLSSKHSKTIVLNYTDYFADINYGFVGYAHRYKKIGTLAGGIKYIHYGDFIHANEVGDILGDFSVSETAAFLTWSNKYKDKIKYGANIKLVYSDFFLYNSLGILLDFGATYKKPKSNFMAALIMRNVGVQITTYTPGNRESLPFEIQLGISQKFKHAPFRFSMNAHNLQQPNIWFKSPNRTTVSTINVSDSVEAETGTPLGEAILRHLTFGVELLLSPNIELRMGYNYQRRQELTLQEGSKSGFVGFSFGFGVKIKKFSFDYARSIYSLAGATNHIGISTNFGEILKKSKSKNKEIIK